LVPINQSIAEPALTWESQKGNRDEALPTDNPYSETFLAALTVEVPEPATLTLRSVGLDRLTIRRF